MLIVLLESRDLALSTLDKVGGCLSPSSQVSVCSANAACHPTCFLGLERRKDLLGNLNSCFCYVVVVVVLMFIYF